MAFKGLRTEFSDFQNKLLAALSTLAGAFSALSDAKTEPAVTKTGLNGATPISAAPQDELGNRTH